MRVTPLDIIQKEFTSSRRGFDADEVRAFLEQIRESMEDTLKDNQQLRALLEQREEEIGELRGAEDDLKHTLLMARRIAEDLERGARREADVIVGEARLEAERVILAIADERRDVQGDLVRLRAARARLMAEMRMRAEAHLRFIDELDPDPQAGP